MLLQVEVLSFQQAKQKKVHVCSEQAVSKKDILIKTTTGYKTMVKCQSGTNLSVKLKLKTGPWDQQEN